MNPEQWSRVKEIFQELLPLDSTQRAARLTEIDDLALREEVRTLLASDSVADAVLDRVPSTVEQWHEGLAPARRFVPGEVVAERFEIRRFVGEGGMGEVYEAFDRELGLRVALKTLKPELAADQRLMDRFKKETQTARSVSHPNVCRVYDFGRHRNAGADQFFCTMEFVDGQPLSDLLRASGALSIDEVLAIGKGCADGLDAAHRAGVLHCDFKSANILIGREDRAVHVTDFGLSRFWSASSQPAPGNTTGSVALGTPAYMAPEQLRGEKPTPASDIYSFGVVLYEICTGQAPYEGVSPVAMVVKKVTELPASPCSLNAKLPPHWEAVLLKCLALRAEDRYATAGAAMRDLEIPLEPSSGPWISRRGWTIAAATAAASAGLTVVWRWPREENANQEWLVNGRMALAENAPWRAAYLLEQRVAEAPTSRLARAHLAIAYSQLDRLDAAKDQLLRLDQQWTVAPRVYQYLRAARSIVLRDLPEAAVALGKLLEAATGSERLALTLEKASALAADGKTKPALELLTAMRKDFPREPALGLQSGILEARLGRRADGLASLQQAEAEFRQRNNPEGTAEALYQSSRLLMDQKALDEAAAPLEQAIEVARSTGNLAQQIRLEGGRAILAIAAGRRGEAEEISARVLQLAKRRDLMQLAAVSENDLASALLSQQLFEDAERHYRIALQLAQDVKARQETARAHLNLASTIMRRGRMKEALAELETGLPFYRRGSYANQLDGGLLMQAQAYANLGRDAEAEPLAATVAKSANPALATRAREVVADLLAWRGDVEAALAAKRQLLDSYLELKRPVNAAYMHFDQAMLFIESCRLEEAGQALAAGRLLLEPLGKGAKAVGERGDIVEAQWMLATGRPGEAIARLSPLAKSLTVQDGLRRFQVLALLGELEARAGRGASGAARCTDVSREAASIEVVGIRAEVLARLAVAGALARQNDLAVTAALEARKLGLQHGYRAWRLLALTVLKRLDPQPVWRDERNQLLEQYGRDSKGPIGPRFDLRADFKQLS